MHIYVISLGILLLGVVSAIDETLNTKSADEKADKPDQSIAESAYYGQHHPVGYGNYPYHHTPSLGVHSEIAYANHKPMYNGYYYKAPVLEYFKKPYHHADGFASHLLKPLMGNHGHHYDYDGYNHVPHHGKFDEIPVLKTYA
ncbi:uncharacterized protein LOC111630633 [Centruroides sculpturatus]|uniref:uncharacterized protein LOC111630633 n=1 Tax=Centruroides sculpturatus TaxID=218467 RepID=UPI000C6DF9F8|nr:uncharacterized protein LOC111630633 [Centruroides sculpturatus]